MNKLEEIVVKPILESLQYIKENGSSVARFGDGEIDVITGHSIPYQSYDPDLAQLLKGILQIPSGPDLLVCLPDVFDKRERYNHNAAIFWESHFKKYGFFYLETCRSPWYGSTFLSRPYIDLVDKSQSAVYFTAIKELWQGRDVLLVEGETTRSGLGNDLFAGAGSVSRIVGPSKNAFTYYDELMAEIIHHGQDKLVILMLGPTAKVLAVDLSRRGYQAIDLGHIDSEYEWFQMGATHKVKLANKHTAEFNYDEGIAPVVDQVYESQILARVGVPVPVFPSSQQQPLVSVIVAFHNAEASLPRLLTSLDTQTYSDFELILVNAASTDDSVSVSQAYRHKTASVFLEHQENADLAEARNRGLERAKGKYVTFIDAGDFLDETYLETLVRPLSKRNYDVVGTNYTGFREENKHFLFYQSPATFFEKEYNKEQWLELEFESAYRIQSSYHHIGMKLFRRSLFEGVYFDEERDNTIYTLYLKSKTFYFVNSGVYILVEKEEHPDLLREIADMEARMTLLATLGYPIGHYMSPYQNLLSKAKQHLLQAARIEDYRQVVTKEHLYLSYQKKSN